MESLPGPEAGRLLAPVVGYVRRRAAERQAALWNTVLSRQAKGSDGVEYVVEVGPRDPDGTWKLVWRPKA